MSDEFKQIERDNRHKNWLCVIAGSIIGLAIFILTYYVIPDIAWKPEQIPTHHEVIVMTTVSAFGGGLIVRFVTWILD